jgi:hypothetical protein
MGRARGVDEERTFVERLTDDFAKCAGGKRSE